MGVCVFPPQAKMIHRKESENVKLARIRMLICLLLLGGGIAGNPVWASIHANTHSRPIAFLLPQQGGATISGTVADASNVPLPGATIAVKDAAGATQSATSDAKGKYRITSLPAGTYAISVSAKGYKNFAVTGIPVNATDNLPLDVLLEAASSEPDAAAAPPNEPQNAAQAPNNPAPNSPLSVLGNIAPAMPAPPPGTAVAAQNPPAIPHDEKTATVTGTVTDQTGAVLADAQIEISNAKGTKRNAASNAQGLYVISGLEPGTYDISVSVPKFKVFQSSGLNLTAGMTLPLDAPMEPAGEKTEINVEAGGPAQIETENAEVSGTITQKEATNLMLNGRNFTQLITLTAGVSNQTGQDEAKVGVLGSVKYSVNGGRVEYNSFEVDGSDVLNAGLSGAESTLVVYPSLDAIQEVKVLTSNYGAQYGRTASGSVQVTTKSGADHFHGNLYEFLRNEKMNARNYFDETTKAPLYRRNDFGGTFGGPLYIPGLYNQKKDKTFFFFSEEARIEKSPSELQSTFNQAVPTLAERQGNFSDVCPNPYDPEDAKNLTNNDTYFPIALYPDCPGVPNASQDPGYRSLFSNSVNSVWTYNSIVPLAGSVSLPPNSGLDPNAAALLGTNLIPLPNAYSGCNSSLVGKIDHTTGQPIMPCYNAVISEPTHWREELFRLDHHFSPKLQAAFRLVHDSWNTVTPTPVWGTVKNTFPTVQNNFVGPGIDMMVRLTQSLTSSLLNETTFSFTNSHITLSDANGPAGATYQRPAGLGNASQAGTCSGTLGTVPVCPMGFLFNNSFGGKAPGLVLTGNNEAYGGAGFSVDPSYMPWEHTNPTFNFRDTFTKVVGKHSLTMGAQYVYALKNETNGALGAASGDVQGLLTFSNVNGGNLSTGNAFANFLYNDGSSSFLGGGNALRSYSQDSTQLRYYNRYWTMEPYIQDDWKATSHFTINLGVRFSLFGDYHEKYLDSYNWEPQAFSQTLASELLVNPYSGQLMSLPGGKNPIPLALSNLDPRITNGLVQCGVNRLPVGCIANHVFNPAPRVGLAWSPGSDGKTSIRAGYGMFFEHGTGDEANTGSLEGSAPLIVNLTEPFPAGYACIGNNGANCDTSGTGVQTKPGAFPINVTSIPTNTRFAYSQQWSLSLQREMSHSFVTTLAYVGSMGTHLTVERQLNQLQPVSSALNPFALHEPFLLEVPGSTVGDCDNVSTSGSIADPVFTLQNGVVVTSNNPASINLQVACQGQSTHGTQHAPIAVANVFRPYPGLGEIFSLQNVAASSYHAFQTTIRRTKGPLTAGVAYTFSHSIDDSSDRTDPTFVNSLDLRSNRASSNYDQRHLVNVSYVYALPGMGRMLQDSLSGAEKSTGGAPPAATEPSRLMRALGDGWQFSGITTYQSGTPFSVINNAGSSGIGVLDNAGVANGVGAGSYPDLAVRPASPAFTSNAASFGPLLGNPNMFVAPRGLTFGNAGRNILNNPSRLNFDMSLLKHFPIREGSDLEFRVEAFNVFNHTQFRVYDPNQGNTGSNTISCYGGSDYSAGAYFPGGADCLTGSSFLHPVNAHRPRTMQLALKYSF
jgi:protocatechuate 3,4-dioxygenase beta subunit